MLIHIYYEVYAFFCYSTHMMR